MKTIALIACASKKSTSPQKAIELYKSDLFNKSVAYCGPLIADDIYILSAKYGLIHQFDIIEPYDLSLNDMTSADRLVWSLKVIVQLESLERTADCKFIVLAGMNYRSTLVKHLPHCVTPMKGLGIGQQLQWLKNNTDLQPL